MKTITSMLVLALLVSGCSTLPERYPNKRATDSAVLLGKAPNLLKIATSGEAPVHFVAVDSQRLYPSVITGDIREVYVSPGSHRITLGIKSGVMPLRAGAQTVELVATAGHTYRFLGEATGGGIVTVREWDEANGEENRTLLAEFFVGSSQVPVVLPVAL